MFTRLVRSQPQREAYIVLQTDATGVTVDEVCHFFLLSSFISFLFSRSLILCSPNLFPDSLLVRATARRCHHGSLGATPAWRLTELFPRRCAQAFRRRSAVGVLPRSQIRSLNRSETNRPLYALNPCESSVNTKSLVM